MRLSRASCGRRARAFDGRFRNAPLCSVHFLFSVGVRDGLEGGNERWSPLFLRFWWYLKFFVDFEKARATRGRDADHAFSSFSRVRTPTVIFRWPFCQGTFSRRFLRRRHLSRSIVCFFFAFFSSAFLKKEREGRITRLRYRSSVVLRLIDSSRD